MQDIQQVTPATRPAISISNVLYKGAPEGLTEYVYLLHYNANASCRSCLVRSSVVENGRRDLQAAAGGTELSGGCNYFQHLSHFWCKSAARSTSVCIVAMGCHFVFPARPQDDLVARERRFEVLLPH